MSFFDMPRHELEVYLPERHEPADFDAFWQQTLEQTRMHPLAAEFAPVNYHLQTVETYDVTFAGYGGQPIKGWLLLPRERSGPLPCVVEYIGYTGGRGFPFEWLIWASTGLAHLVMDNRGQGSGSRHGDTPDFPVDGANPAVPGFMTQGIRRPATYFYRRLFTDAVRAVEAARSHPAIDPLRIAVTGVSQGGGTALAVAGLDPNIAMVMPDVPFLCHYRRAIEITDDAPYSELVAYCKSHRDAEAEVFHTLSYFDGVNFAVRARAKAFFSVALMDTTCPPSTVFAAYNHYAGERRISVWPYNSHEGGGSFQTLEKIRFLNDIWKA